MEQHPTVGRVVHYVSYGTPGGEYDSRCRAATVAEVGAWVETGATPATDGRRTVEQEWDPSSCALVVLNPTGMFFNTVPYRDNPPNDRAPGGTWHWPERS